jgi:hypothetical protein
MTFDSFISAVESIRTIYSVSIKGGFSSDEESDVRIRILEELSKLKTFSLKIVDEKEHPSYLRDLDACKDAIIEWDPQGPWLRESPSVVKTLDLVISGSIQIASQIQEKLEVDTSEIDINMVQISTEVQQLKEILKRASSMLETLDSRVSYLLDKQHSINLKALKTVSDEPTEVETEEEELLDEVTETEEEKSGEFDIYYGDEETEQSLDDNIRSIIEQKLGSGPVSDDFEKAEDETSDILVKGITSYFSKSKGFASEVHKAVKETDPLESEEKLDEPPTRLSQLIDISSLEKQIARFRKEISLDEELNTTLDQPIDHKSETDQLDDAYAVDSSSDSVEDFEEADLLTEEDFMDEDLATLRVKHEVLLSEISMMRIYLLLPDYDTQGIRREIDAKLSNARLIKNRILELENTNSI